MFPDFDFLPVKREFVFHKAAESNTEYLILNYLDLIELPCLNLPFSGRFSLFSQKIDEFRSMGIFYDQFTALF